MGYEADKVYNKVYLGEQTGEEGTGKKVLIDMTRSGDTPEAKSAGHTVQKIEDVKVQITKNVILSKTVTGGDNDNEAWSSSGHLITGTCTFNADVSTDDISAQDVLNGLSFHVGGGMPGPSTGSMPNYRGLVGDETAGETSPERKLVITPQENYNEGQEPQWVATNYILADNETAGSFSIPEGAYGYDTGTSACTQIRVAGIDPNKISNEICLFGVRGQLNHNIEPVHNENNPKLNEYTINPTPGHDYAGMAQVVVAATPISNVEDPQSSGSYTCYIGSWTVV